MTDSTENTAFRAARAYAKSLEGSYKVTATDTAGHFVANSVVVLDWFDDGFSVEEYGGVVFIQAAQMVLVSVIPDKEKRR